MLTESFVTDTPYLQGQARVREGLLHIQVPGQEGNREYGYAFSTENPLPKQIAEYLNSLTAENLSLAGTGAFYFPIQLKGNDESVHVQIAGPELNRSYGAAFDIGCDGFGIWVQDQITREQEETKEVEEDEETFELGDDIFLS